MKITLRFAFLFASAAVLIALVVAGTASNASAQTDRQQQQQQQQQQQPITGGYGAVDVADKDVQAAARYAVKKQTLRQRTTVKLISVNRADRQVVAGLNYRLCLTIEYRVKGKKARRTAEAIVYQNLKQKFSLSSFSEYPDGCPDR